MPRWLETWISLCNIMLKLCGISRSSAILGSDSPQSNNRKVNFIHSPRETYCHQIRYCRLFKATTAYTSPSTDAKAALAPQLSGGTKVRHWQSARRLWPDTRRLQLPLDDCCRLVFRTMPNSMQLTEQILDDPPRMGAKSTTTVLAIILVGIVEDNYCSHTVLWTHEVRSVKTFRIDGLLLYSGPEGSEGSVFQALHLPAALQLSQQQVDAQEAAEAPRNDGLLRMTVCVLSRGLETLEDPLKNLSSVAELLPAAEREWVMESVSHIQTDVPAPFCHAMRFVASGFNDLAFHRRDTAVAATGKNLSFWNGAVLQRGCDVGLIITSRTVA